MKKRTVTLILICLGLTQQLIMNTYGQSLNFLNGNSTNSLFSEKSLPAVPLLAGNNYMYAYGKNGSVTIKWDYQPDGSITYPFIGCKLCRQNYFNEPLTDINPEYLNEESGIYEFTDTLNISDTIPYIYTLYVYYTDSVLSNAYCQALKLIEFAPIDNNTLYVKIVPRIGGGFGEIEYCDYPLYEIPFEDSIERSLNYSPLFDYCWTIRLVQSTFIDTNIVWYGNIAFNSEFMYNFLQTVGIESKQQNLNIEVYPNPGTDYFYIKNTFEGYVLNLYNSNGQLLFSHLIASGNQIINTMSLSQGLYFIKVVSGSGHIRKGKWIKM